MLILGWAVSGPPDAWHHHLSVGVRVSYGTGGGHVALTLAWDPTPIRYRPPPEWVGFQPPAYCGYTDGWNVYVFPAGACRDTLAHEMGHVAQRRSVGPLGVALAALVGAPLEPPPGSWYEGMWVPRGDGFALLRLEIPIPLDTYRRNRCVHTAATY